MAIRVRLCWTQHLKRTVSPDKKASEMKIVVDNEVPVSKVSGIERGLVDSYTSKPTTVTSDFHNYYSERFVIVDRDIPTILGKRALASRQRLHHYSLQHN